MRTRAKVDANQPDIVAALRGVGASVLHIHQIGKGAPDIVVGFRGKNYLLEIKDGSLPPSARGLTPDEEEFHAIWRGNVATVKNCDEALTVIGARLVIKGVNDGDVQS